MTFGINERPLSGRLQSSRPQSKETFPSDESEVPGFYFIFQKVQKIIWPEHWCSVVRTLCQNARLLGILCVRMYVMANKRRIVITGHLLLITLQLATRIKRYFLANRRVNFNEFVLPPVNLEVTNLADECKLWLQAFGNYLDCYETQQRRRCCTKGDFVTFNRNGSATFAFRTACK